MFLPRAAGVLLHPTSLPSTGGLGDLGAAAYKFLDWLAAAKQGFWQVLPLGPLGYGNSPYSSTSAFAGNPLLISLERLAERGWLPQSRLSKLPAPGGSADYERARAVKLPLLRQAAQGFLAGATGGARSVFEAFCREQSWWLEDFVLFAALHERHGLQSWNRWPPELAQRRPAALEEARISLAPELDVGRVLQFAFFEQWRALHQAAAARGIRILGDVAIFISYDSADVWTHPALFHLDEKLEPYVVAGVPPDVFSSTGQRWGNPLYRWDVLHGRGYDWWVRRMRWALHTCDLVRLDHFRGFEAYWEIPAHEPTAVNGRWVAGPGDDFFHALRRELGGLPLVAEDLGLITPEVLALRDRFQLPGMKVMQFGFGDRGAHIYLPHRFETNCVVYTGTHDNDTTPGWWKSGASQAERRAAQAYFGQHPDGMHWAFIRAAQGSVADACIIPVQDYLGLGSEARMNVPSRADGNWTWRLQPGMLTAELAAKLAHLAEVTDRDLAVLELRQQRQGEAGEDFAA
jgi:4-alpha-glucanotransferase